MEVHKQNIASSKQTIGKQSVDPLQSGLGEQNVPLAKLRLAEQNVAPSEIETWGTKCCSIRTKNWWVKQLCHL